MKNKNQACPAKRERCGGFTLLEILLVVGIISILAGIVIVAINPARQLATVRNAQRKSDIKQINNALLQYYIDEFEYPTTIPSTLTEICDTGEATSSETCGSLVNLSGLVPTYITSIPVDPQGPVIGFLDNIITKAFAAEGGTGYSILKTSTNKIGVQADRAELEQDIVIGMAASSTGTTTEEVTNYALEFDGSNYVEIPYDPAFYPSSSWTLEAWVKFSYDDQRWILGNYGNGGGAMFFGSGGVLSGGTIFTANGFFQPNGIAINDNTWHHVAITYNSSDIKFWNDGVLKDTISVGSDSLNVVEQSFYLGYTPAGSPPFVGSFDEVRFSNVARYSSNFTPAASFTSDANTIALYKMNEGTGNTVSDTKGHNGTSVGSLNWVLRE